MVHPARDISDYLRQLEWALPVGPVSKRRILREIETHLLDAVQQELRSGNSRGEAERRAMARLGSPQMLAARFSHRPKRSLVAAVAFATVLGGAAAVALVLTFGGRSGSQIPGNAIHPGSVVQAQLAAQRLDPGTLRQLTATSAIDDGSSVRLLAARGPGQRIYLAPASLDGSLSFLGDLQPLDQIQGTNNGYLVMRPIANVFNDDPSPGWDVKIVSRGSAPLAVYEVAGGLTELRPSWIAVVGVALPTVFRVTGTSADGRTFKLPLNKWRAFQYASKVAHSFPLTLSAFDARGALLGLTSLHLGMCGGDCGSGSTGTLSVTGNSETMTFTAGGS